MHATRAMPTPAQARACARAGCNAPEGECLGSCMQAPAPAPMRLCRLTVGAGLDEQLYSGIGLYRTTCDAVIDALDRFPDATRITVEEIKR